MPKVEIVKRVDADVDSQVIVQKHVPQVHKSVSFSGSTGVGGNFFNDIFNVGFSQICFQNGWINSLLQIPISALTSVNRFLNNNVGGNVHYQKTVGVY